MNGLKRELVTHRKCRGHFALIITPKSQHRKQTFRSSLPFPICENKLCQTRKCNTHEETCEYQLVFNFILSNKNLFQSPACDKSKDGLQLSYLSVLEELWNVS